MYLEEKVTPQAVPLTEKPIEPWQQVCLDAADYIDAHGWCQGVARNGEAVCMSMALYLAAHQESPPYEEASARILANAAVGNSIPYWNDLPGRTKEEVTGVLRKLGGRSG